MDGWEEKMERVIMYIGHSDVFFAAMIFTQVKS